MLVPVILSGGSGTRLWPLSRAQYPKQFLDLFSDKTMIQETVLRLDGLEGLCQPTIVCNIDSRFIVAHQMMEINKKDAQIVLEPIAKNTLPAITAAVYSVYKNNPEDILFVLPSDHTIKNIPAFHEAIKRAQKAAEEGNIVTFGINPTRPEVGYGYIQFTKDKERESYQVTAFKEKPDLETAKKYLTAGNYVWNSGMFMFKASVFMEELNKYSPEIYKCASESVEKAKKDLSFIRLDEDSFANNPSISIDYGLMEKTSKAVVVPMSAEWSDVGAWDALWEYLPKDERGNYKRGDVVTEDSDNNYIYSDNKLVTTAGVKDLIVVDTKDALFVADKKNIGDIKPLFENLKKNKRKEAIKNRVTYKPWGYSDSIEKANGYKVNHLTIKPGEKPSVHYHLHHSEHWIVLSGTATITVGKERRFLTDNESVYIPIGTIHAVENEGKISLHMIEIQTGSYLEDDDLVRVKDFYGRE